MRRGDQSLVEYTEVLAKVSFFLIKVPKLATLRSRDPAKIGQIAYPQTILQGPWYRGPIFLIWSFYLKNPGRSRDLCVF